MCRGCGRRLNLFVYSKIFSKKTYDNTCYMGPLLAQINSTSRIVRGRRGVPGVRQAWRRQIEPQNHSVVGLP